MKKAFCFIMVVGMILGAAGWAWAEGAEAPAMSRVILYTYYRQMGWGDRVQIGCVDDAGVLWLLTGYDGSLKWPYQTDDQLAYLQSSGTLKAVGRLSSDDLFSLESLVFSTEDQGQKSYPAACDAGTEKSYAVRYDRDGEAQCILLGMSGDSWFENCDPDAQALYRYLRLMFPQVTCYGGTMGPAGFLPVPIRTFCGMDGLDLSQVTVSACYSDCEAGPIPLTLTEAQQNSLLRLIMEGKVTGKANATVTTGGTVYYALYDREGSFLASIELYQGLLVRSDGMYIIEK